MPGRTPDYRYVVKTIFTPAGTLSTNPQKTTVDLGDVTLLDVQIIIPDGHSGDTGIAVVSDGFGIVPWSPSVDFIIGNNEEPTFGVDMTMGHAISVWTYNIGAFDHRHYLRFRVRDSVLDTAPAGPMLVVVKSIPDATTPSNALDVATATSNADDGSGAAGGSTDALAGVVGP